MVLSCLVEPLVQPLVGRGTRGPARRTALSRGRLAASALAVSALLAVATNADAQDLLEGRTAPAKSQCCARTAHKKPAAVPYREVLARFLAARREDDIVVAPALSADFEQEAIGVHRLRHARNLVRDSGPGLGVARRLARVTAPAERTFLLFASGQHMSGAPNASAI
ncbi:MAG: hypothetical protein H6730_09030 [Deltaproteobacteria bacterium]|nr:hypothetical protein [Deltaproteobacteria bacterium]